MKVLSETIFTVSFFYMIIRVTTPILFAAMGALVADRAGTANIGLEGIMLISALFGVLFSAWTGSAFVGLIAAIISGVATSLFLAYFTLQLKTNVILGGIALNLFADGVTVLLLYNFTGDKGASTNLLSKVLPDINIPFIQDIPVIGKIISGHNVLTYVAFISVILISYTLRKTAFGLQLRSVGENEDAAKSVGINVNKMKYIALAISGFFASLGGAFLSMGYVSWFARGMAAGRGWIAIAAEAMGRGNVLGTFLSSVLFGIAQALSNVLSIINIPSEIVYTLPYVVTIIALIIYGVKEKVGKK